MDEKLSQSNPFPPIFLKAGLLVVLLASSTSVVSSAIWIYHRIHHSLGLEVAEVVVSFLVILILGLILVGLGAGFGAKRVLRRRKVHVLRICRSLKLCKFIQPLWGDVGIHPETDETETFTSNKQDAIVVTAASNRRPRRGRLPNYPMDRWIKVVSAWENRDTLRNPITLEEFLSQEFGTWADGSPRVAKKTFYDNQMKVHTELHEQEARKKSAAL
jgi:hypothetical protein